MPERSLTGDLLFALPAAAKVADDQAGGVLACVVTVADDAASEFEVFQQGGGLVDGVADGGAGLLEGHLAGVISEPQRARAAPHRQVAARGRRGRGILAEVAGSLQERGL